MQQRSRIFVSKTFYCLWLTYHLLFVVLNLSLYFGFVCNEFPEYSDAKSIALEFQTVTIFLLIANTILMVLLDSLPLSWITSPKWPL